MSSTTISPELAPAAVRVRKLKLALTLTVVTVLLGALFLFAPRSGETRFRIDQGQWLVDIGTLTVPSTGTMWTLLLLMAVLAGLAGYDAWRYRTTRLWVPAVFGVLALLGFLTWAGAGVGGVVPLDGLLIGGLSISVPIVFGALGGVIGERVGVVNVAIEGQLLLGAFSAAVVGSLTNNPYLGLIGAMVGGVLVSLVLAVFSIRYLVDQVIVGVVLNVLVAGLTSFLYGILLVPNEAIVNRTTQFPRMPIPGLVEIPLLGPALFNQPALVYFMYIAVALVAFGLYRTRWGLRLRAVGEHPQAADTVGIKVNPTRFWNVTLAGAIAGAGGAYFTLFSVPQFVENQVGGLGFIALAAVIFGRWDPLRAALAALLFGMATNLRVQLDQLATPVPGEFMKMLPYVITILAVVGFVGQSRGPAAAGKPYIKG